LDGSNRRTSTSAPSCLSWPKLWGQLFRNTAERFSQALSKLQAVRLFVQWIFDHLPMTGDSRVWQCQSPNYNLLYRPIDRAGRPAILSDASTEDHMLRYRTNGTDLLDGNGSTLATVKGAAIYDSDRNRIAALTSIAVRDLQNNQVAVLHGTDVYDGRNRKIATLSDIYRDIDSALGGPALIGLWLFFVRHHSAVHRGPTVQEPPTNPRGLLQRLFHFGVKSD